LLNIVNFLEVESSGPTRWIDKLIEGNKTRYPAFVRIKAG